MVMRGWGRQRISRRAMLVGGSAVAAGALASRWIGGSGRISQGGRQADDDQPPARAERRAPVSFSSTFVVGANYEGPADRAWQMWAQDRFDSALMDADLAR